MVRPFGKHLVALGAPAFARKDAASYAQKSSHRELSCCEPEACCPCGRGIEPRTSVWSGSCFQSGLVFCGALRFQTGKLCFLQSLRQVTLLEAALTLSRWLVYRHPFGCGDTSVALARNSTQTQIVPGAVKIDVFWQSSKLQVELAR